jgi:hypothetical protein
MDEFLEMPDWDAVEAACREAEVRYSQDGKVSNTDVSLPPPPLPPPPSLPPPSSFPVRTAVIGSTAAASPSGTDWVALLRKCKAVKFGYSMWL